MLMLYSSSIELHDLLIIAWPLTFKQRTDRTHLHGPISLAYQGSAHSSVLHPMSAYGADQVACLAIHGLMCVGVGAGLLTPDQRERWNHFHGATALSKAVHTAVALPHRH